MTTIDPSTLTGDQLDQFLASPMSDAECQQRAECEQVISDAYHRQQLAELELGRLFLQVRDDPKKLWQRSDIFRTKSGGWKKTRSWDAYVKSLNVPEVDTGSQANQLIEFWLQHQRHLALAN
jgi:hypothetical protein